MLITEYMVQRTEYGVQSREYISNANWKFPESENLVERLDCLLIQERPAIGKAPCDRIEP